jgi:uncharacterized protein (TIGR00369 family)
MPLTVDELRAILASQPMPVCVELTPFEVLDVDEDQGRVRVQFAPQPAFGNHFDHVQGGFVVAMLDVPLSLAVFVKTKRFLPTIEIKTSFVSPARIGVCTGEAVVVRAGASLVFAEARLWSGDGTLAAHATATALAATGASQRSG